MTPDDQAHWFDYEAGYALRIRETETPQGRSTLITAKQLLRPADHSAMTNLEKPLTAAGAALVLSAIGDEFADVVAQLQSRAEQKLSFAEAKKLIESAGRKEYITLEKQRSSFQNPGVANIVIDLDVVPALQHTSLGFYASIEIEHKGSAPLDEARAIVRSVSAGLGYDHKDILDKALPGLAIPHVAQF